MITWIYGNSGSGKTTLANCLKNDKTIILDGDDLRHCWDLGFLKEDRREQNIRAAKLGLMLEKQGFSVIIATICPYNSLRDEISKLGKFKWILCEGGKEPSARYPFEN